MSTEAGTGAPTDGGQQGSETTGTASGTGTGTVTAPGTQNTGDWSAQDWKDFAEESGLSVAEVKKRLEHSRTWEQRAKDNKTAADQAKTLQEQLDEMQRSLAERDERDAKRAGQIALTRVRSALAESGIKADDVQELLNELDPKRLLKDGEPDDKAIDRIVGALRKAAGRATPDPDQGKAGGKQPNDMNAWIRQFAGGRG